MLTAAAQLRLFSAGFRLLELDPWVYQHSEADQAFQEAEQPLMQQGSPPDQQAAKASIEVSANEEGPASLLGLIGFPGQLHGCQ